MDTIKEIQSTVKNILAAPYGVEFYILEMSDEVFSLHQLNIGQDKTYERIISQYKKQLNEVFLDTDSSTIQDIYDIDQRRDVFYQVEDVSSVSRLNAIDELLSVDTYATDDFSQCNYSKIWGFLITIGNDEESITLFRKHYKMKISVPVKKSTSSTGSAEWGFLGLISGKPVPCTLSTKSTTTVLNPFF